MPNTTHSSALAQFLDNMHRYHLLTAEEEIEIAKTIAIAYTNGELKEGVTDREKAIADRDCPRILKFACSKRSIVQNTECSGS